MENSIFLSEKTSKNIGFIDFGDSDENGCFFYIRVFCERRVGSVGVNGENV